jgi:hypothetical protein
MQQALEALTIYSDAQCSLKGLGAITALRTALEQPQPEPVACVIDGDLYFHHEIDWEDLAYQGHGVELLYTTPPAAQPEQVDCPRCGHVCSQRPWVGLEAEDLAQIDADEFWQTGNYMVIAMAVEAKLKERNT